jgi:methyl-accepting chemotaxis protein
MKENDSVDEKLLSETDKLILKLDSIINSIKGKNEEIDYNLTKDGFEKLKFQIQEKLKNVETFLEQRDKILNSTVPHEIFERKQLETKIEKLLNEANNLFKELEIELNVQKRKKGKYGEFDEKEKMKNLMNEQLVFLNSKFEGVEVTESQIIENRNSIEQLDMILNKQAQVTEEEELTDEVKEKMEEWKKEQEEQDKGLDQIKDGLKILKNEIKLANENIESTNKVVKKVTKHTDTTKVKVQSTNKKLKDLITKIRSSDKICVDIILILVLVGLICALYNIIKG